MYTCRNIAIFVALFNLLLLHCHGVTINRGYKSKHRINTITDLKQIVVSCRLNDMIIIDVPVINRRSVKYLLYRPNGDITKLNITYPIQSDIDFTNDIDITNDIWDKNDRVKFLNKPTEINEERNYEVFNIYEDKISGVGRTINASSRDIVDEKRRSMKGEEFMIGPLDASDHGNWLISCVYEDEQGHWVGVNQNIIIEITENVPADEEHVVLRPGESFEPKFKYPVADVVSCSLFKPAASVDKAFVRNRHAMKSCGFVVPNIAREDAGYWTVVGFGRVVYVANIWLEVRV